MLIPGFPAFKQIDLSMKDAVKGLISRRQEEASEYTFTNLFAFRETYAFKLSMLEKSLVILRAADPVSVFCPIGNILDPGLIFDYLREHNQKPYMERVTENFVKKYVTGSKKYVAEEAVVLSILN